MENKMSDNKEIKKLLADDYKLGFETLIESETFPVGLNEDVIRAISKKKNEPEWLLDFRLKAYAKWLKEVEPEWAKLHYPKIDYQKIAYFSAPKKLLDSMDEVDPILLETYEKLGIPLEEQKMLAGVAVDVYPTEPKSNDEPFQSDLSGQPNTILTPHIGGSTMEAQKHIGNFVPSNIISYINTGSCFDSVNLPPIKVGPQKNAHRFLLIHDNISGVMAEVTNILAKYNMNITGQSLKTDETVGYLITDVDQKYDDHILEELRGVKGKIKFRLLF